MGLIPEEIIQQVLDRTDIAEHIGSSISLKRAGRNWKGLCPFHNEKTPSFVVTPDKQIFHCFGCHAGGNVVSFVMKHERLDFVEAVHFLAEKAGIVMPELSEGSKARDDYRQEIYRANEVALAYYHRNLMLGGESEVKATRDLLQDRAVSPAAARRFQLGYAYDNWEGLARELKAKDFSAEVLQKSGLLVARESGQGLYDRFRGRLIFPIFDYRDRVIAFGARALKKDDRAKYINSPETPVYVKGQHCYGLNWSKDALVAQDSAIVVEGYMDFISPFDAGVENVIASQGTALTPDQIRLIRRYTHNVIMLFDMDAAGQMAALRSLDILLAQDMNVRVAALADKEDPDSFIRKYGVDAFRQRIGEATRLFDFKLNRLMAEHDAGQVEGRAKICQEMLPTIGKMISEVVRDGYIRELSTRLKIPEGALIKEQHRLEGKLSAPVVLVEPPKKTVVLKDGAPAADESLLLRLMCINAQWISEGRAVLVGADFKSAMVRAIVEQLFELQAAGKGLNVAGLLNRLQDEASRSFLTGLLHDGVNIKNEERIFHDCVKRIKEARLKSEGHRLREEIKQAERSGDWDAICRFREQFNALRKG